MSKNPPTIDELFKLAAESLRFDFEKIRKEIQHYPTSGQEGEELLTDEIVQSAVRTEVVADVLSRRALVDPDFMELRSRTAHDQVLSFRIRRTEVRPMLRRREISDLLRPERCSLRT